MSTQVEKIIMAADDIFLYTQDTGPYLYQFLFQFIGRRGVIFFHLADTGFTEAVFHRWTGYRTSTCTKGGLVTARKPRRG